MANMKNAEKRIKVNAKKQISNNEFKASMRTAVKTLEKAVVTGDKNKADEALKVAIKKIDKAASKGAIKENAKARKKSRITKKVNEMN